MIDLALETDLEQLFIQPSLYPQDPDVLLAVMRHPRTVMTFSDSGAHLSQIADASIHTHLLGYWVRDRQEFTLEEAVRMLTLAPAMAWGFADRGLLREGMVADLNVFDPDRVGPGGARDRPRPARGREAPLAAGRGLPATVVGGEVTILDGEPTGARPGRLVREPLARRRRSAHPEHPGDAVVDAPRAVAPHHVVDVAHAERAQSASSPLGRHLVHDRVGVEARGVGAGVELDDRVGEQVHARAAGVGREPIVSRYVGDRLLPERAVDRAVGIEQRGERVVVALVDGARVALRELPEELAVDEPLDR